MNGKNSTRERRKRVYIASPYWNDSPHIRIQNVEKQIIIASRLRDQGFSAFWPLHSHYEGMHFPREEKEWLSISMEWITACDVLLRQGKESFGADREVELANALNMPVYYELPELIKNEKTSVPELVYHKLPRTVKEILIERR